MRKKPFLARMQKNIKERVETLDTHMRVGGAHEIARRYFVMNSFDGVLTMLGIIVGAYGVGKIDPVLIVSAGIGASIAMGVSGMTGAYMTEKAERNHELRRIERAMLRKMENTIFKDLSGTVPVITALIDGLSPALAGGIIIVPYVLSLAGWISVGSSIVSSIVLCFAILFLLGIYLGRISGESLLRHGIKMVAIGVFVSLLISVLHEFF